jgi:uncharacterized DUF497 family protein
VERRRARAEIEIASLLIDEAKEAYIGTKGVQFADILEVLAGAPRFFVSFDRRGERYAMLGPNQAGRYLLTAIANVDEGVWRVVSAYWLRANRGRRLYEER